MNSTQSPPAVNRSSDNSGPQDVLNGILSASREGMLIVDSSMRITAANDPAHDVFGRRGQPLVGRRLTEVVREPHLHQAFQQAVTESAPTDLKLELPSGVERRSFDVHVAPIQLGGVCQAIGVFYDISKLERLERVRQEFLSNISHELRTPLTSILAYVETLEDSAIDDPDNNRRFLAVIRRNAERMHGLIADIAELSQIESGNVSLDARELHLSALVDEIFAAVSSKASGKDVVLVNDVPVESRVRADLMRLEQMITNLVDNAIKFNRPGGTVTVAVAVGSNDGSDLVSVADTGEGIMSENLHRIFERFYRIDRGRTRDVGGTGLGLAIVKHLARLHGGEVSVNSVLGQGTTFTIELPRD
ncbi:MAG TPA: ATP-binding protein [Pyrinomonadaceae bacterium]|nr:ATP-binding protein [Pyrinomonadaceae bacterium]